MNMDSVNKWLILVANIGVIAGIVFLGIEIDQNQSSIENSNIIAELTSNSFSMEQADNFRL